MANEIMSQLSGVASEIDTVSSNAEIMKQRIREWEESFPSSLSSIGHPKAIADLISRQNKQIQMIKDMLELEKRNHDKDVTDVLRSMNVQLQAAQNSSLLERQQLAIAHQNDEEAFRRQLAEAEGRRNTELEACRREHKGALARLRSELEVLIVLRMILKFALIMLSSRCNMMDQYKN